MKPGINIYIYVYIVQSTDTCFAVLQLISVVYMYCICIVNLEFHSEISVFKKYILVLISNWYIFLDIDN